MESKCLGILALDFPTEIKRTNAKDIFLHDTAKGTLSRLIKVETSSCIFSSFLCFSRSWSSTLDILLHSLVHIMLLFSSICHFRRISQFLSHIDRLMIVFSKSGQSCKLFWSFVSKSFGQQCPALVTCCLSYQERLNLMLDEKRLVFETEN